MSYADSRLFLNPRFSPVDFGTGAVAIGDVNGDGKNEVVATTFQCDYST
jgi:hypothetical protein